ncbi:MAG: pyridoxal-phosphate dependent enzyme [Vulcanimicrobiota bacterium]
MISTISSRFVCVGCGYELPISPEAPLPFRCPRAGRDDVEHVLKRQLDSGHFPHDHDPNPFVAFRHLFTSYQLARTAMSDADYVELVRRLDERVARVDGRGFLFTPCVHEQRLSQEIDCEVWVKDETGNVAGSHKARHLFGIILYLEVVRRLRGQTGPRPRLAIASCGNAALAAAVVAAAAEYPLKVFIPLEANPLVVERLRQLGAELALCPRHPEEHGDPCLLRFRQALAGGALPFGCQGPENGLTIEGGQTLAYELLRQGEVFDQVFIQVGGGALASSFVQAYSDGLRLGAVKRVPTLYAVQTEASPLLAAWNRLDAPWSEVAAHRSRYMRPWPTPPHSVASGILDDETYDWFELVKAMKESGGRPLAASEELLNEANWLARQTTDIAVSNTGTAGLAGLLQVRPQGRSLVLFTGLRRSHG